ncbi:hypothetical protein MHBO_004320 [Bonamia ostreae]|uniref:Uncharacterized protein n=1 Tax=Bonamia ostreae TaxID=126728 RepID=A0ABV2ASZ2_9EUKA
MSQTDLIDYPRADLALNAAGGSIVPPMIRFLNSRSTVVTYGSMSKKAILVPASTQIFKQICYKGFWLTSWVRKVGADAKLAAIEELYVFQTLEI